MKNKKILLGSLTAVVVASIAITSVLNTEMESEESKYSPRSSEANQSEDWSGAKELYKRLRANVYTGEVNREDYIAAYNQIKNMSFPKAQTMSWVEHGPDNIGGRTRAILVDKDDSLLVYAGSVSGGLWKSTFGGTTWEQITAFEENLGVSSICQTEDGTIYVATGHTSEGSSGVGNSGYNGNGVYYTTDAGASFQLIAGTDNYSYVNEVVAVGNDILIASSSGVIRYSGGSLNTVSSISALSLEISEDESLVFFESATGKTFRSTDGGNNFSDVSGSGTGQIPSTDMGRMEYAISKEKVNGNYKVYAGASNNSGRIRGAWASNDGGATWTQIAPNYNDIQNPTSGFTPYSTSRSSQGNYNNILTVDPNNPDRIILGGIDLYDWSNATGATPPVGEWNQASFWNANPISPIYVHADNHELTWDQMDNLYVGNDGGIGKSSDGGQTFYPSNRGYNVTQFYSVAFSAHGDVMGGAQDNGTLYNDHTMFSWKEFREVMGGDGFDCDISFRSRDIMFASIYNGGFQRSNDRGQTWQSFIAGELGSLGTPGEDLGGFYTSIRLYENPNDLNSADTINYLPTQSYSAGETVTVPSFSSQDSINVTLTNPLEYDDTVYYEPSLTQEDTVVGAAILLGGQLYPDTLYYDLGQYDYDLTPTNIAGNNKIDITDTVIVLNTNGSVRDSVVVDSIRVYNHYFAQNGSEVADLGTDTIGLGVAWDTLRVQDIRQSWFAFGIGGTDGVWITRQAMRFSQENSTQWYKVLDQGGAVKCMEFSKDGQHLFVGTFSGQLYRISGFGDVYSSTPKDSIYKWIDLSTQGLNAYPTKSKLTVTQIHSGNVITGIATSVTNPDHVVVTTGGFGGNHVWESTTATTATGTGSFSSIDGTDFPSIPAYDVVIERDDPNTIIVGTEFGVWSTENGGGEWTNNSDGFGNVPVFAVRQSWRTWNQGNYHPGEIFIGTHGRGIWSSTTYLGLPDDTESEEADATRVELKVYPNPMRGQGTIELTLTDNDDVNIQVYSLSGQLVKEMSKTNTSKGTNQFNIDVSDLRNGVYIIKTTANGTTKTAKIVKQ